ncbi:CLUMA_CG000295, isoform A [Clunio marinus]|uniref:CLUMA_CG000295, isoform A n=1 Tax=Clunio marinus TaxID=568069 RepID=A0A1J1HJR6_9DIPT|nr:CLUMA_CG000295, isoform A [Clunio marinus]
MYKIIKDTEIVSSILPQISPNASISIQFKKPKKMKKDRINIQQISVIKASLGEKETNKAARILPIYAMNSCSISLASAAQ